MTDGNPLRCVPLSIALALVGCFGSHSYHPAPDAVADADPDAIPPCWPPAAAPGVVPCDIPLDGRDDPCRCGAALAGTCVLYSTDRDRMHGYCYRGVPEPAHGPLDTSPCPGGLTLQYHRASLSLGEYQAYADLFFRIYCVPPEECVRVRDYDTSGPLPQCIYGDFTIAETGVVPAPGCGERPGGLMMCSAGCACAPGYDCGPYSEQHPWAPCYPTGTLVPSMPFDGAWMTRVLTPEQARRNLDNAETERHYVDRDYCSAVAAQFLGLYACDALPAPAP